MTYLRITLEVGLAIGLRLISHGLYIGVTRLPECYFSNDRLSQMPYMYRFDISLRVLQPLCTSTSELIAPRQYFLNDKHSVLSFPMSQINSFKHPSHIACIPVLSPDSRTLIAAVGSATNTTRKTLFQIVKGKSISLITFTTTRLRSCSMVRA